MMATIRFLHSLNETAASVREVRARDLRSYSHQLRRFLQRMRIHVSRELWQNVLDWGRLGEFNAGLVVQKTCMVQAWKRHITSVVQAIVERVKEQIRRGEALLLTGWKKQSSKRSDNEYARNLPPHLKRLKEYRTNQGKMEFWRFAGLKGAARREFLDLKNGLGFRFSGSLLRWSKILQARSIHREFQKALRSVVQELKPS